MNTLEAFFYWAYYISIPTQVGPLNFGGPVRPHTLTPLRARPGYTGSGLPTLLYKAASWTQVHFLCFFLCQYINKCDKYVYCIALV